MYLEPADCTMKIAIPKEVFPGECRVSASPDSVRALQKLGYQIAVEQQAGIAANFSDEAYREQGAEIVGDARTLYVSADIVLKVRAPQQHPQLQISEIELLKTGSILISFLWPGQNPALLEQFRIHRITALGIDQVPRISRAQKLDGLSTMANVAGYRAVVEAAQHFSRFFSGQSTAAGQTPPAKVLIIGAGVAGLAAIGAARGLGAMVRAFDSRPEVAQQIESMGADFLTVAMEEDGSGGGGYAKQMSAAFLEAELALFRQQAEEVDIIITTALVPGKPAPRLITEEIVQCLRPGSVIVDLAAEQGGNCELTEANKVVVKHGVTIIGYTDLTSRMANQSSRWYANNLAHLMSDLTPDKNGVPVLDMNDAVIRNITVVKDGEITWPPPPLTQPKLPQPKLPQPPTAQTATTVVKQALPPWRKALQTAVIVSVGALALFGLGKIAPATFMADFTVFVLSCFIGWQVIWNVAPALHTPLMSVTNAISGIIIIGALLQTSDDATNTALILALIAAFIAMINVAGGFLVTQRMLKMFRRTDD